MKICSKCGIEKDIDLFDDNKYSKDGKRSECKVCRNLYYQENKKRINKLYNENYKKHPEYKKEYYRKNKEKKNKD